MLDKLDEIIKKFVAVFLFPLVNIVVLSLIVYFVANPNIHAGLAFSQIIPKMFNAVVQFIGPNLNSINSSLTNAVQAASSFIAATIFVIFLILIYLIDRAFYALGFFLPPNFAFNLEAFEKAFKATTKGGVVLRRLGTEISALSVEDFYPVIRAYLGHKNGDANRIAWRANIVSQIDFAQRLFRYAKAYVCFLIVVIMAAFWQGQHVSALGVFFVTVAMVALFGGAALYFANACRRLVEYDLESYLWAKCYEADGELHMERMSAGMPPSVAGSRSLLSKVNLKFVWLPE